jgi:hypothetical protein
MNERLKLKSRNCKIPVRTQGKSFMTLVLAMISYKIIIFCLFRHAISFSNSSSFFFKRCSPQPCPLLCVFLLGKPIYHYGFIYFIINPCCKMHQIQTFLVNLYQSHFSTFIAWCSLYITSYCLAYWCTHHIRHLLSCCPTLAIFNKQTGIALCVRCFTYILLCGNILPKNFIDTVILPTMCSNRLFTRLTPTFLIQFRYHCSMNFNQFSSGKACKSSFLNFNKVHCFCDSFQYVMFHLSLNFPCFMY